MKYGEFGEEEKALNLVEIIVDKPAIDIRIYYFQVGGFTHLKMALMLLWMMVPGKEVREEENESELLEEV